MTLVSRITLLSTIALAGCTVGPNYQRPDLTTVLPDHYQQIDDVATRPLSTASTGRWWETFNDPVVNQLVETALKRNLDLASADASIRQARAQFQIADSANQPQLNADGRVGRDQFSKNSENFANIPFPHPLTTFTEYRVGLDASWEIDLFGRNSRRVEAAKARMASAEFQRQGVELSVGAEVVRNVIDYRAWHQRTKNAQSILSDSQQLLDLTVIQRKAGLFSDSEVIDATTALHQAAASIAPLQSAEIASIMAITVLTDQTQEQVSAMLNTNAPIPSVAGQIGAVGLPSDLLLRRPDIQSAERELAAATADIGEAVAEQYPQINLLADGGLVSITPGKLTQLASRYWSIGPQISVPLLSGGRLAAQVSAREAARDAALAQYRQSVLTAFADTETSLIGVQREQQRLEQIRHASVSQQQQLKLAEQRNQLGDTNMINVLQSRQVAAQITDSQLISEQALADNLTLLYKSLGGGITQK